MERLRRQTAAGEGVRWSYGYRTTGGASEATALAALALHARADSPDLVRDALDWLANIQDERGGVPATPQLAEPLWPTALALAASARVRGVENDFAVQASRHLLTTAGTVYPRDSLFGHDPSIKGWSWVAETHSWVEPTGYAMIGLRAAGHAGHARVAEGARLLRDRCLPEGGWNYGNTRVLGNLLRPFPATTGVALLALVGEERTDEVERSLDYLRGAVRSIRSPISLGWSLMALRAWGEAMPEGDDWISDSVTHPRRRPDPMHDALLVLALSDTEPMLWGAAGQRSAADSGTQIGADTPAVGLPNGAEDEGVVDGD